MLPYIKVYPDFINVVRELDNGARGRLFLAIMQYANGEKPDELTGAERIAFIVVKSQIDRDADAYEASAKKQSENGKKGGRPKKPTAFFENPKNPPLFSETHQKPKKPEKEKEKEKEEDKDKDKDKDNTYFCAEPESASTPPVVTLPLNDGALFPVAEDDIAKWSELYPAVDILAELRKMAGWLDANPTRRKTKAGIRRFVNGWLAKEQDRGGCAPAPTYQSKAAERNAQYCQHDAPLSPLERKAVERAMRGQEQ